MNEKTTSITQKTKYLFWCNMPFEMTQDLRQDLGLFRYIDISNTYRSMIYDIVPVTETPSLRSPLNYTDIRMHYSVIADNNIPIILQCSESMPTGSHIMMPSMSIM